MALCSCADEVVVLVGADAVRGRVWGGTRSDGSHVYASEGSGSYRDPESAAACGQCCARASRVGDTD